MPGRWRRQRRPHRFAGKHYNSSNRNRRIEAAPTLSNSGGFPRGRPLLRAAPRAPGPGRAAAAGPRQALFRAARAAADGEDVGAAGAAGSAAGRGFPLRVRQRRGRADGPRGRGAGDARRAGRTGLVGGRGGRRLSGPGLVRPADAARSGRRVARGADALGGGRPAPAGAADRRDRRAGGRLAAGGAAAVAGGLRPASGGISAERGAVRSAGRAGLPHPFRVGERGRHRGQRVQREGEVVAAGRFLAGRGDCAARSAHGGDGAGVHGRGAGAGVGADAGAAVAGERAGGGRLFRGSGGPGPVAVDRRGGDSGGAGAVDPAAGDAPGPVGGQAAGGSGCGGWSSRS